ncbi:MAG: hypothetical protein JOY71_14905, partial [Acetobacteraceae bacterium]|nr:hypothetical protein [Acetobacteraceae bacterium]
FIPFAATRAEREAVHDARLSLEERYPDKQSYVSAFQAATERLVAQHFLLPEDARKLAGEAAIEGIRSGP